jgi:hypothetical protein
MTEVFPTGLFKAIILIYDMPYVNASRWGVKYNQKSKKRDLGQNPRKNQVQPTTVTATNRSYLEGKVCGRDFV